MAVSGANPSVLRLAYTGSPSGGFGRARARDEFVENRDEPAAHVRGARGNSVSAEKDPPESVSSPIVRPPVSRTTGDDCQSRSIASRWDEPVGTRDETVMSMLLRRVRLRSHQLDDRSPRGPRSATAAPTLAGTRPVT